MCLNLFVYLHRFVCVCVCEERGKNVNVSVCVTAVVFGQGCVLCAFQRKQNDCLSIIIVLLLDIFSPHQSNRIIGNCVFLF